MSRLVMVPKLLVRNFSSSLKYPLTPKAFAFLDRCRFADIDLTSVQAPDPSSTGITPTAEILSLMKVFSFHDFIEDKGTSRGDPEVLDACAKYFNKSGIKCSPKNVSLTPGILFSLEKVFERIGLNESNKVLVTTPTFGFYFRQFKDQKIGFDTLETKKEEGFLPNPNDLERMIEETNPKALLLCYPNNPTGVVMTEKCAREISDIAIRRNLFVISDEAFSGRSVSGKEHFPIAAVDGMLDRSFTVTSSAKSFFTGRKIAFCVGRQDIIDSFEKLGGYPTKQDQRIVAASIKDNEENNKYLEESRLHYLSNIRLIESNCDELNKKFGNQFCEESVYVKPYISNPDIAGPYLLDFSGLRGKSCDSIVMQTGLDAATWLLDKAGVATVPGECFGLNSDTMTVRIALNSSRKELEAAFSRMKDAAKYIHAPSRSFEPTSLGLESSTLIRE